MPRSSGTTSAALSLNVYNSTDEVLQLELLRQGEPGRVLKRFHLAPQGGDSWPLVQPGVYRLEVTTQGWEHCARTLAVQEDEQGGLLIDIGGNGAFVLLPRIYAPTTWSEAQVQRYVDEHFGEVGPRILPSGNYQRLPERIAFGLRDRVPETLRDDEDQPEVRWKLSAWNEGM